MRQFILKIKLAIRKHPRFRRFFFSFFFRLLLLDFKKNSVLVLFWFLFFGFITNNIAKPYGVAYLFLGPEYLDNVSWLSYFIIGFSCGGFIMAYNMSSYIKNGFRFPFLATLKNPFLKYCTNNFVFPASFVILYIIQIILFLIGENDYTKFQIALFVSSFIVGNLFFVFISFTYFFGTGKDITKLYGIQKADTKEDTITKKNSKGERNANLTKDPRDWYVETYLATPFKRRLVRSVRHYKKEMLKAVIKQNHKAAFVFQMITILSLISLGLFSKVSAFEIPAGASLFLLFTVFIMLFSSFYTWFRGWSGVVFVAFLLLVNYLHKAEYLSVKNKAYGLNYNTTKADYSYKGFSKIDSACQAKLVSEDIASTIQILNKWKAKNTFPFEPDKKPKLILINTSGGGLRSSLWTLYSLQYADSLSNGKLLDHIQLISGSSGGMVGAAYLRELYLLHQKNKLKSYYDTKYQTNISKDILNPITFTIATSEWLFPFKSFDVDGRSYFYDRGTAFEQRLEENTNNIFDKRLADYKLPEANAYIPMMVFTPSIVNDGRKLMISPQGISYLTQNIYTKNIQYNALDGAIEYSRFFKKQSADKTLFTSVLRMSATFPYISPIVTLPSNPRIEVMDAGLRDNYGLETSLSFIKTFNDWIAENTSGIVIIQIRDKHKLDKIEDNPSRTLIKSLSRPSGNFYSNLFQIQDFNQNVQLQMADAWCKSKIEIIDLQLHNEITDRISLSWHLTQKEKKKVLNSINMPENQAAIKRIVELVK